MPNGNAIDLSSVGGKPVTGGAIDLSSVGGMPVSARPDQAPQPSDFMRFYENVGGQIKQPFQATAEELSRLNRAAGQGQLFQQIRQDFPPAGSITGALTQGYGQFNPVVVKKDEQGNIDWPATIGATAGKTAAMAAPFFLGAPEPEPANILSEGKYSPAGDRIASSLKPTGAANIDMPAVTNSTLPTLRESFADLGGDPRSFQGREGTLLFKKTVQNAIDITETRANQVLVPIIDSPADPALLSKSPDLVEWIGEDPGSITNQMVDEARREANRQLTRGNYFLKPRSKQLAAPEATIDALNVGNQARNVLYTQAQDATGYNLYPLRAMESNLITLADSANATHNWLSGKEAAYQSTGPVARVVGGMKAAVAVKASPLSALSVGEQPGLFSPLNKFNSNMQDIFAGVIPEKADTGMNVRIPGKVSPVQIQYPGLPENVPGYSSMIPGSQPFAPPGYQLGPATPPSFPQPAIPGRPYIPQPNLPLALPAGQPPVYVEPTTLPFARALARKGVPATRNVPPLFIEQLNK